MFAKVGPGAGSFATVRAPFPLKVPVLSRCFVHFNFSLALANAPEIQALSMRHFCMHEVTVQNHEGYEHASTLFELAA